MDTTGSTGPRGGDDRLRAAQLLREARRAAAEDQWDDRIDWAYSTMPDGVAAVCLKVRGLLRHDDCEAARAVLAQALLLRPTHPALGTLRAETLLLAGERAGALREISLVLDQRPTHVRTLRLAATIARSLGDAGRALQWLEIGVANHPKRDDLRADLIHALLDADNTALAGRHVERLMTPDNVLRAKVYQRQGRGADARHELETALVSASSTTRTSAYVALLELLEDHGDLPRLMALIDDRPEECDATIDLAVARSMLTLGQFGEALRTAAPYINDGATRREALRITIVAAASSGQPATAREALSNLYATSREYEARRLADLWRRAWVGSAVTDPAGSRESGADPQTSVLQPLLTTTIEILDEALNDSGGSMTNADRNLLLMQRSVCQVASGRSHEMVPQDDPYGRPVVHRIEPSASDQRAREAA
jgi:thioredoxin-like negative regulator of GroEL